MSVKPEQRIGSLSWYNVASELVSIAGMAHECEVSITHEGDAKELARQIERAAKRVLNLITPIESAAT